MKVERVRDILARIRKVKVAVYGDFCLDAYWHLSPRGSEVSVETGQKALAAARQSYSLGGAGNVVANLAALEPAGIMAIGVTGPDVFGREIIRQMEAMGVDTGRMCVQDRDFATMAYCKQYSGRQEKSRVDFGTLNQRSSDTDAALLGSLREAAKKADVVILNQQVAGSIQESFIKGVNGLIAGFPGKMFILDSRHHSGRFGKAYRKLNQRELARLVGAGRGADGALSPARAEKYAAMVYRKWGRPVFVTRGERGMLVYDAGGAHHIPGLQITCRVDPVGAGDTVLSALAVCLAAGVEAVEAAEFAGLAASVTVCKTLRTGTASGAEILAMARDADYVYMPETADDIRLARHVSGTEIELCCGPDALTRGGRISHAVFDNDGTLSVLRRGWDEVMEKVMVEAILGGNQDAAAEGVGARARSAVREYIGRSAGTQTIVQMETLVEMIREFGVVPPAGIRSKEYYRDEYYGAIMALVGGRLRKVRRGELSADDLTVRGALDFLRQLRGRGVTLYLASGARSRDVVNEARALGYADLFNGGIYGVSSELARHPKTIMIENIIRDNRLKGNELVCFGDGPVEIRECRRRGGTSVGVASDEAVRYGLNAEKRTRLIRAGAHLVVPDFSQGKELIRLLFGT